MNLTGKTNQVREPTITQPRSVETCEGLFPFKKLVAEDCVIEMPIRVRLERASPGKAKRVRPDRDAAGRLLYALPGGGCTT